MTVTACDGSFSNFPEIQAQCEGCEGCDGSRRCVISSNYYNNLGLGMMTWRKRNEYNFNNNTHIEKPSQPSHPHNRAQFGVTAILEPSQPSHPTSVVRSSSEAIENGLDFILSHFEEPIFPRKISTYKSENKQFLVRRSKQEIINAFADSNFVDCRINAYPCLTEYKGIQRYKPDLLFIDLDKKNDDSQSSITVLKLALSKTLRNIKEKLSDGFPTVLMTGNGYHIIQPVYCPTALENITEFQNFDKPSEQFLRFVKDNLSNGRADKNSNPSFKSCLLRIPGSINSKYDNTTKVKIVQKWNKVRPPIPREFIEEFRTCMIQKKIDEYNYRQKMLLKLKRQNSKNKDTTNRNYYKWIDKTILANPFPDYRKIIVNLILAPYLVNIKKLSYEESYQIIREWLDKCNSLRKLDNYGNFVNYRVHQALKAATQKGIGPMNFYKIKTDSRYNTNLYLLLLQKGKGGE